MANAIEKGLGALLRKARKGSGLGVEQLADLAAIPAGVVRSWEDEDGPISPGDLDAVTRALGLRVRDLRKGPEGWPLDGVRFKALGHAVSSASDHRAIMEFRRCVEDAAELETALGHARPARRTLRAASVPEAPHGANELAAQARQLFGRDGAESIPSVTAILRELDVLVLVTAPDQLSSSIHAASTSRPRLAVLLNHDLRPWQARFALAHELCHLLVDLHGATDQIVSSEIVRDDLVEVRANAFAAAFLAPGAAVRAIVDSEPAAERNVIEVARRFGVGRQVAINRIADTHDLGGARGVMEARATAAWAPTHPEDLPSPGLREGALADLAMRALGAGKIDPLRAREVLGLRPTDALPAHPAVDAAKRAPLRDPAAAVLHAVDRWLFARDAPRGVDVAAPVRGVGAWVVRVRFPDGAEKSLRVSDAFEVSGD